MFGYDAEQGAKAFCITEMFIGYLHSLIAIFVLRLPVMAYINHISVGGMSTLSATQTILFVTYLLFTIGLLVQAVCGVLLYFVGYKKKNVKMLWIWFFVALFNFTCPVVLTVFGIIGDDLADTVLPKSVSFVLLYLLYIDIGLATVGNYIKHIHKTAPENSVPAAAAAAAVPSRSMAKGEVTKEMEKSMAEQV